MTDKLHLISQWGNCPDNHPQILERLGLSSRRVTLFGVAAVRADVGSSPRRNQEDFELVKTALDEVEQVVDHGFNDKSLNFFNSLWEVESFGRSRLFIVGRLGATQLMASILVPSPYWFDSWSRESVWSYWRTHQHDPITAVTRATDMITTTNSADNAVVRKFQSLILQRIVRPGWKFDPRWLTPIVQALSSAIYKERAWDRCPVLADALEEAGCNHLGILGSLRKDTMWFPGEWIIDKCLRNRP